MNNRSIEELITQYKTFLENNLGSLTSTEISEQVIKLITRLACLKRIIDRPFHANSDGMGGGDDDADNLEDAINSLKDGETLVLPLEKSLRLSRSIDIDLSDRSINIDLNGCLLVFDTWNLQLSFDGGWQSIQSFDGISMQKSNQDVINGIEDTSLLRTRDYIRIISDDMPKDTWKDTATQANDLFVEEIIDEHSVSVSGHTYQTLGLDNPYVTNPRICQRSGHSLRIYNGIFSTPDNQNVERAENVAFLFLKNLQFPIANNISSKRAYGATIRFKGCIHGVISGGYCGNHDDFQFIGDENAYGYGVVDASYATIIANRVGHRVRHLVDTDDQSYGANQSPELYGGSSYLLAISCKGTGTSNSTFSTHHSNKGTVFQSCEAYSSLDAGFGLRGDVTLKDCRDYCCKQSINIFDEANRNPSDTVANIYDHISEGSGPIINSNYGVDVNFFNYTAVDSFYTNNHWINTKNDTFSRFHGHTRIYFGYTDAYQYLYGTNNNGTVTFDTMEWDVSSELIPTNTRILICNEGGTYDHKLFGNHLHIRGTRPTVVFRGNSGQEPVNNLRFKLTLDSDYNYGSSGVADTMILTHGGAWALLGGVTECDYGEWLRGNHCKVVRAHVNFGFSVAAGSSVSATVAVEGSTVKDSVKILTVINEDVTVNNARITADGIITIRITNNSNASLDLSATPVYIEINKV